MQGAYRDGVGSKDSVPAGYGIHHGLSARAGCMVPDGGVWWLKSAGTHRRTIVDPKGRMTEGVVLIVRVLQCFK